MKHTLCQINAIPDPGAKEFSISMNNKEIEIFLVCSKGEFFAYENYCPHTGASLNWQKDQFLNMENNYIQCCMHNALFEIDSGYCVAGPCSGSSLKELQLSISNETIVLII